MQRGLGHSAYGLRWLGRILWPLVDGQRPRLLDGLHVRRWEVALRAALFQATRPPTRLVLLEYFDAVALSERELGVVLSGVFVIGDYYLLSGGHVVRVTTRQKDF